MPQFSRPVYEGLPWFYIICGLAVLGGSYLLAGYGVASLLAGIAGLLLLLGGVVVLLRRRDYRELRAQYGDPDSLSGRDKR
jgi:nitrate reductase gamma subunit